MRAFVVLTLLLPFAVSAAPTVLDSGTQRVTLVELYTSEGCNTCPPADEWLSGLQQRSELWNRLVPLALHVDYWDRLGWEDRFADPRFSQRQRQYAAFWGHSVVYTPGFVVNGEEWRGGPWRQSLSLPTGVSAGRLVARSDSDGQVTVRYTPESATDEPLEAHVALLGFDRRTPVKAGENAGRTLHHDFVALRYVTAPLQPKAEGLAARLQLPGEADGRLALAVWVSPVGEPVPLQAAGGWLATGADALSQR